MSKRAFAESSSPARPDRPAKRRQISRFSPLFSATINAFPRTPRTPHTPHLSIPSDSPTNPFGRQRSSTLALPRPTSFGKHLAFRFQLVRKGSGRNKTGVHRIVQVPLNYTFRHLHKLLYFLFDGPQVPPAATDGSSTSLAILRRLARENASNGDIGHLFEVQETVVLYNAPHKAGQIRTGKTWAKLSRIRDPFRYRDSEEDEDEVFPANCDMEKIANEGEGENESENMDWRWEAEDDFTLAHVWSRGPDLSRAIIYVRSFSDPTKDGLFSKTQFS